MWFIGLVFKKSTTGAVNITITYEIQVFINAGRSNGHLQLVNGSTQSINWFIIGSLFWLAS